MIKMWLDHGWDIHIRISELHISRTTRPPTPIPSMTRQVILPLPPTQNTTLPRRTLPRKNHHPNTHRESS